MSNVSEVKGLVDGPSTSLALPGKSHGDFNNYHNFYCPGDNVPVLLTSHHGISKEVQLDGFSEAGVLG